MEAEVPRLATLYQWAASNGGYLHPNMAIVENETSGVHLRSLADIPPETKLCSVPHSLALSRMNALVDDEFKPFCELRLAAEVVGYFYLMRQYILKETSFWWPYLATLPDPNAKFSTPFWFDDEDLAWLVDTDVFHTALARKQMHEDQYQQGLSALEHAKIGTEPYTRRLFQWAVTIFTSRSFSSLAIRPQDSKYWAAHRTGPDGRRQTVLLDMSHKPAEELDFPVLFPLLDVANHHPRSKIELQYDPGRSAIVAYDHIQKGQEAFNNYGRKGNDELLLGYGFCVSDNPYDKVLVSLKKPAERLQDELRKIQPGYFTSDGEWSSEKATFGLTRLDSALGRLADIFQRLPEPLLELMFYIVRHERGLPFQTLERPQGGSFADITNASRYYPFIARMVSQSLAPKLAQLQASTPSRQPANANQKQAQIYRQAQIQILLSVTSRIDSYIKSLIVSTLDDVSGTRLATLEIFVELLKKNVGEAQVETFLLGVQVNAGTTDLDQLRQAGWEEDVFVLLLCFHHLSGGRNLSLTEYVDTQTFDSEELEQARSLLDLVGSAAKTYPGTTWEDERWSERYIAGFGGKQLRLDSFVMDVDSAGINETSARLMVAISVDA